MKIEHLYYLLETVSSHSINQASKKLYFNHQHLGQILDNIERELETKLLQRTRTGITLTPAGKMALPIIEEITQKYDYLLTILQEANKLNDKKMILNIYMTANLEPDNLFQAINKIQESFFNLEIVALECEKEEIIQNVFNKEKSLGLMALNTDELTELTHSYSTLDIIKLKTWPVVALVHRDSSLTKKFKSISLKTLLNYDIVLYAPFSMKQTPVWHVLKQFNNGKDPLIKYNTSNLHMFHNLMTKDHSITLGVNHKTFIEKNNLIAIPLRDNITVTSVLILRKSDEVDFIIQQFVELCKKEYI